MAVDFDTFLEWATDRFGEENIKIRNTGHGTEICTQSFFARNKLGREDSKFHLWMNPSGGKSDHPEGGSYRCWLTDSMGSLVSLVANVDHISYDEAEELITGVSSLRSLELKVHEFFGFEAEIEDQNPLPKIAKKVELPDFSFLIENMSPGNFWKKRAKNYLDERKIPIDGLYVCTKNEKYGNRIVIPWHDSCGEIVFWNARTMSQHPKALRYLKALEADQSDCLYMTDYPAKQSKVYIMEGEFDAISLKVAKLTGCACGGKYLSDSQVERLRGYRPVLAFDADGPGLEATITVGNALLERGFSNISYVRPPVAYKDWNNLLKQKDAGVVADYIRKFEKPFTSMTTSLLKSNRI